MEFIKADYKKIIELLNGLNEEYLNVDNVGIFFERFEIKEYESIIYIKFYIGNRVASTINFSKRINYTIGINEDKNIACLMLSI